jgi:Family of unknown function (DUF6152)
MRRSPLLALFSMGLMPTGSAEGTARTTRHPIRQITPFRSAGPAMRRRPPPGRNDPPDRSLSVTHRRLIATVAAVIFGIGLVAMSDAAVGHHSVVMFDREHPIQLTGVVREFKFTNPHAFIALEVTGKDALPVIWNLEGDSVNSLKWDGWSSQTLKPGDELRITVEPLRSGAPGGVWHAHKTTYKDGTPIVVTREKQLDRGSR